MKVTFAIANKQLTLTLPSPDDLPSGYEHLFPQSMQIINSIFNAIMVHHDENNPFVYDQILYQIYIQIEALKNALNEERISDIQLIDQVDNLLEMIHFSKETILNFDEKVAKRARSFDENKQILLPMITHRTLITNKLMQSLWPNANRQAIFQEVADLFTSEENNTQPLIELKSNGISKVFKITFPNPMQGDQELAINIKPIGLYSNDALHFREEAYVNGLDAILLNPYDLFSTRMASPVPGGKGIDYVVQVSQWSPNGSLDNAHRISSNVNNAYAHQQLMGIKLLKEMLKNKATDTAVDTTLLFRENKRIRQINASIVHYAHHVGDKLRREEKSLSSRLFSRVKSFSSQETFPPKKEYIDSYLSNIFIPEIAQILEKFGLHMLQHSLAMVPAEGLQPFFNQLDVLEVELDRAFTFTMTEEEEQDIAILAEKSTKLLLSASEKGYKLWDIKCGNIMLDEDRNPVLVDEKTCSKLNAHGYHVPSVHTQDRAIEHDDNHDRLFTQEEANAATAYQLGRVFYELMTGSSLMTQASFSQIIDKRSKVEPLFDLPVFTNSPFGGLMRLLITGLCKINPQERMSLNEVDKHLSDYTLFHSPSEHAMN